MKRQVVHHSKNLIELLLQSTAERVQALMLLASKLAGSPETLHASSSPAKRESKAENEIGRQALTSTQALGKQQGLQVSICCS